MKLPLIILIFISIVFTSCHESLENRFAVKSNELSKLSELGLVECTITKIVKATDTAWYKLGDRKILFSCRATVKAGIDMSNFSLQNVEINEERRSINLQLPHAKVLVFSMPLEASELVYENVSITRFNFTAAERNKLLRQGEADIRADIECLGILTDAERNAMEFFRTLLSQMGFEKINIEFV